MGRWEDALKKHQSKPAKPGAQDPDGSPLFPAGELTDRETPVPPFSAFTLQDHDPLTVPYPDEPPDGLEPSSGPKERLSPPAPRSPRKTAGSPRQKAAGVWRFAFLAAVLFLLVPAALILSYRAPYRSFQLGARTLDTGLIFPHVYADGTELSGMTPKEAEAALSSVRQADQTDLKLTIHLGGDTVLFTADQLSLPSRIRDTVEKAYAVGRSIYDPSGSLQTTPFETRLRSVQEAEAQTVSLSTAVSYDPENVRLFVSSLAERFDVPAKNAGIVNMDYVSRTFSFSDEQSGLALDQPHLTALICSALDQQVRQADLQARFLPVLPTVRKTDLLNTFGLLSIRSVQIDLPKGDKAVRKLAAALNGALLQGGAKLSFHAILQNAGYSPSVFDTDPVPTQIASALMDGALCAGLNVEKRYPLSQLTDLIPPGTEAAISPEEDLVLADPSGRPFCVLCYFAPKGSAATQGSITLEWYGILGTPGEEITLSTEKTAEADPPEAISRRNPELPPGRRILAQFPRKGETWVCSLVRTVSGKQTRKDYLFTTTYAPVRQIIEYNDQTEAEGEPSS